MDQHTLEVFTEIMDELGIKATPEQFKEACETFTDHLSMMSDMRFEQHRPDPKEKVKCSNCERLESELKHIQPVSRCCGKDVQWSRTEWVCVQCNRPTIRVPKN